MKRLLLSAPSQQHLDLLAHVEYDATRYHRWVTSGPCRLNDWKLGYTAALTLEYPEPAEAISFALQRVELVASDPEVARLDPRRRWPRLRLAADQAVREFYGGFLRLHQYGEVCRAA